MAMSGRTQFVSRPSGSIVLAFILLTFAPHGLAKGLDELAEENPAEKTAAPAEETEDTAPPEGTAGEPPAGEPVAEVPASAEEPAAAPRPAAVVDKLFLATSYGWAKASKSEGEWKGGGMSDLTVGYLLPFQLGENIRLFGTYRYAPMAVSGVVDGHSYRGVFEAHNFGTQASFLISEGLKATASFEVAYVLVYLDTLDGLELNEKHESDGGMAVLGGGADWTVFENIEAGPRLFAGFGQITAFQLGASAAFVF